MSIIQLKEANCKNCYKCIRHCDVKSITFHDDQAHILEDECVLCGKCTLICPQNAKQIESDVQKVCSMIDRGEKVYASVAPSFIAALPEGATFASLSSAMKRLGFAGIEETAIGATAVSEEYAALAEKGKMPNLITTCCPTVNLLVEKYFPDLLDQLAPVPSPAVAHARMLRQAHGDDIRVVFVGPCISKKNEVQQSGVIDAVLMYRGNGCAGRAWQRAARRIPPRWKCTTPSAVCIPCPAASSRPFPQRSAPGTSQWRWMGWTAASRRLRISASITSPAISWR